MKIRPLHDWAIITITDAGDRTAGGLIIPESAREKPAEGTVVSIGPGVYKLEKGKEKEKKRIFHPTSIKPGDGVVFSRYSTVEVELDGQTVSMIREEDILGTTEKKHPPVPRPEHRMAVTEERPPMVQTPVKHHPIEKVWEHLPERSAQKQASRAEGKAPAAPSGKAATRESAVRKPTTTKEEQRVTAKKATTKKKTTKKAATPAKKTAVKKTAAKKTAKKTAAKKTTAKKPAKKTVTKKATPKKTVKKVTKKKAAPAKKTTAKKKTAKR